MTDGLERKLSACAENDAPEADLENGSETNVVLIQQKHKPTKQA